MLHTIIRTNTYQDSVSLMVLSTQLSELDNVHQVSIMMGTPANKDIFRNTGFDTPELDDAAPGDMVIVIDAADQAAVDRVEAGVHEFLTDQRAASGTRTYRTVRSLDRACAELPAANLAVVSIPGELAAPEIERLLDRGLNVFVFSDNIDVADEIRLKEKARDQGLMLMGPDCGTGSFGGLPLAFTNIVSPGSIGIVGASGTGTQEVMTQVDRAGGGISQAIGLGGRDLSERVGAITCLQALDALEADDATEVICLVSKPPAPSVRERVLQRCQELSKPVVAILLGEEPKKSVEGNIHFAATLANAARLAVDLAGPANTPPVVFAEGQKAITGLFCGGTLAAESAILLAEALGVPANADHPDGYMLHHGGHTVIDLGDDAYTQGRPHPMIDPSLRAQMIGEAFANPDMAVLLVDVVTGYGSHENPAGAIVPAILEGQEAAKAAGREVVVVASVCGTEKDPQPLSEQRQELIDAGVVVLDSNAAATRYALDVLDPKKTAASTTEAPPAIQKLVSQPPTIINVGLSSFADALQTCGADVVQYNWSPLAGGNTRLQKILAALA